MKYFSHSKLALLALTLASSFATSGALADYRLTAFSDTVGFQALRKRRPCEKRKSTFASRSLKNMDYFEANNLCVAQILLEEYDAAIASCSSALAKSRIFFRAHFWEREGGPRLHLFQP